MDEELTFPISERMMEIILAKLREKLHSEDEYVIAEQIFRRFLEGGARSVRIFIDDLTEGEKDVPNLKGDKD